MNGVDLSSLNAKDFLDVIHYFFEEDSNYATPEQAVARTKMRKRFYRSFYDQEYLYGISDADAGETSEDGTAIKPYIPPTEVDPDSASPFGAVLDAPIG